jgi:hypothetical protein
MAIHAVTLCTVVSLFVGGVAFAEQTGTTSGPATGPAAAKKSVEPSTVTEKRYESDEERLKGGAVGGGRPGVESMPGTEGGKAGQSGK